VHLRKFVAVAASAGLLLLGTGAGAAVVDVDNFVTPPGGGFFTGSGMYVDAATHSVMGQTWTVGISGQLTQIDLFTEVYGSQPIDVTFAVYRTPDVLTPGSDLLGSLTLSSTDLVDYGVMSFNLSTLNINALAGDILSWKMSLAPCPTPTPCDNFVVNRHDFNGGPAAPAYDGGWAFFSNDIHPIVYQFSDHNFRTWVSAAEVPEPQTWALLILGFGGAGAALRRRRALSPSL